MACVAPKKPFTKATKPTTMLFSLRALVSQQRVPQGLALAGATMCVYFVDSRFRESAQGETFTLAAPELVTFGIFLLGLLMCQWQGDTACLTPKQVDGSSKPGKLPREPRSQTRRED